MMGSVWLAVVQLLGYLIGCQLIMCQAQCPALTDPDNGAVMMSGVDVGDTAIYSCEAGFFLSETVVRDCRGDNTWSRDAPFCVRAQPLSCIVKRPFVRIREKVTVEIYGVPGSPADSDEVCFSRDFDTSNAVSQNIGRQRDTDFRRKLQMPLKRTDRGARFGIFACSVNHNDGTSYTIRTAITAARKGLIPVDGRVTRTVSQGDKVTLSVTDTTGRKERVRWLQNGNRMPRWNGGTQVTMSEITTRDEGVYEIFQRGRRKRGLQTFILLYVRGCPDRLYGANCDQVCNCLNGGLCDALTGECTCPPGFDGVSCETVYEMGSCRADYEAPNCRTLLFCLPGKFGCICGPGWYGLGCKDECPGGRYGAGCTEECEAPCDPLTGL